MVVVCSTTRVFFDSARGPIRPISLLLLPQKPSSDNIEAIFVWRRRVVWKVEFIDNIFGGSLHSMGELIDALPSPSVGKYRVV